MPETLTGLCRRSRAPFELVLAPLSSSLSPLQNPGGLDRQRRRKNGAVVMNSNGGGGKPLDGHSRRFRQPKWTRLVALDSCILPLHDPKLLSKLWFEFDHPPSHYPIRDNGAFPVKGTVPSGCGGARVVRW